MREYLSVLANALGAEAYQKHAICISNDYLLLLMYTAADLTTFVAYIAIGVALMSKRNVIANLSPPALAMYGTFIVLCGLSHLTMTMTLYVGIYRLDIAVRSAMAAVSAVTAVYTVFALWGERDA